MMEATCPKCDRALGDDERAGEWRRCAGCGCKFKVSTQTVRDPSTTPLPTATTCAKCNRNLRGNARHCHHCGAKTGVRDLRRLLMPSALVASLLALAIVTAAGFAGSSVKHVPDAKLRGENERLSEALQAANDRLSSLEASRVKAQAQADSLTRQLSETAQRLSAAEIKAQANPNADWLIKQYTTENERLRAQYVTLGNAYTTSASDLNAKIGAAEKRAEAAESRVVTLSAALDEALALAKARPPAAPAGNAPAPEQVAASIRENWTRLSDSLAQNRPLTQEQVRQILGPPDSVHTYSSYAVWDYRVGYSSGSVTIENGRLKSLRSPR